MQQPADAPEFPNRYYRVLPESQPPSE